MALDFHKGPTQEQLAYDLAVANRFTLEELELNKAGRIAGRQLAVLGWRSWLPMWTSTSAMLGWFLALWVGHALLPDSLEAWLLKKIWFWKLCGIAIIGITLTAVGNFAVCFLKFGRRTFMLFLDTLRGDAQSIHGRVSPSWEEVDATGLGKARGDKISVFKYCVKDQEFEVTSAAYNLLVSKYDDCRPLVRLYYAPRSRMLLSIAPEEPNPVEVKQEDNKWVFRGIDGTGAAEKKPALQIPKQNDPDLSQLRRALGTTVKPVDLPAPPPPNRQMNVRRPAAPAEPSQTPVHTPAPAAARPSAPPGAQRPAAPPAVPRPAQAGPPPPVAAPRPPAPKPAAPPPNQPRRW